MDTTFTMDTSGAVIPAPGETIGGTSAARFWSDVPPLAQGYITALFACFGEGLNLFARERIGWHPEDSVGFSEIAWCALARIIADCEAIDRLQAFRDGVAYSGAHGGAVAFRDRQSGKLERHGLLPQAVELGEDGKVRFIETQTMRLCVYFSDDGTCAFTATSYANENAARDAAREIERGGSFRGRPIRKVRVEGPGLVETRDVCVISTGHLSGLTCTTLDMLDPNLWPVHGGPMPHGFFIYCHDAEQEDIPDDLWACIRWAWAKGFDYILFDSDAETYEGLATYEH